MVEMNCMKAAQEYVKMGFSIIPVTHDKRPAVHEWKTFQSRHALPSEIEEWWTKWPGCGVGIITGTISGLVVVDIDSPEAANKIADMKAQDFSYGIGEPPTVITGKGFHLYYRYPTGVGVVGNSVNKELGLDIRGEGGYVVAPPSTHPSGRQYRWVKHRHLWNRLMPTLPSVFLVVRSSGYQGNEQDYEPWAAALLADGMGEGGRNDAVARLAGRYILKGLGENEVYEIVSMWNSLRNSPPLPEKEVETTVASIMAKHKRGS